ncbi:hypothetical protein EU537_01870 [Candidatus Thorarchaeota archaeon]|nr:MAG: hypothetical protein EU537_01870 [Candidatus Thorarchaeota archaeon]
MELSHIRQKIINFLRDYLLFIFVLVIGLYLWGNVFSLAIEDYMESALWRTRGVWLGEGSFDLLGFAIHYQFEGYTDYSFYYIHWGHNMLRGVMPYCEEFGHIVLDGYENNNGLYIFPPLYAYLYAIGVMLPIEGWGIGLLLVSFGFLTAFPVFGIAKELSENQVIGAVAALTYLLNPNILYHITFAWLNPSPFIFFFFSGFYMLIKGRKDIGTISIVVAALFKQMAWFLGIPLVVYLLVKPNKPDQESRQNEDSTTTHPETDPEESAAEISESKKGLLDFLHQAIDFPGFARSSVVVIIFVLAVLFPFLVAQPNILSQILLAAGGSSLEEPFTEVPGYPIPMTLQVLAVVAELPLLAEMLNFVIYQGILLSFGVVIFMGIMLLEPRPEDDKLYLRRVLFLTLLLMLFVHLAGPRGVYKYYFTLFAPFFSIFSSQKMITSKDTRINFSSSMLWVPIALSFSILIPPREVYLFSVLLIFIGYLAAKQIGAFWSVISYPFRFLKVKLRVLISHIRQKTGRDIIIPKSKSPN